MYITGLKAIHTLPHFGWNSRNLPDDIFKCIFLNEKVWIPIKISLKFVTRGAINNIPALLQIMAWRREGDKPLSEPMMVSLPTHIYVTRPQWVKFTLMWSSPVSHFIPKRFFVVANSQIHHIKLIKLFVAHLIKYYIIMTSSNGNTFRVTGSLWGNPAVTGGFPSQSPVTQSFDVFFDVCLIKRFMKQTIDTPVIRAHYDVTVMIIGLYI